MTKIEPLSGRERAYLHAFRDANAMPDSARERVWARLAAGPVGAVGGGDNAEPVFEAVGGGRPWFARPGLLVGSSLTVASGVLVLALFEGDPSAPDRAPEVAAVVGEATNEAALSLPEPAPELTAVAASLPEPGPEPATLEPEAAQASEPDAKAPEPAPPGKRSAARSKPVPPPTPTSSLAEERRLIEATHAALGRGAVNEALASLRRHAREFESGVFVEEREALLAIATCTAGQLDEGRAAARSFLASYPQAVLAARVRKGCGLED